MNEGKGGFLFDDEYSVNVKRGDRGLQEAVPPSPLHCLPFGQPADRFGADVEPEPDLDRADGRDVAEEVISVGHREIRPVEEMKAQPLVPGSPEGKVQRRGSLNLHPWIREERGYEVTEEEPQPGVMAPERGQGQRPVDGRDFSFP